MRKIYLWMLMFVAFSGTCFGQTIGAVLTSDAAGYCQGSTITFTVTLTLGSGCNSSFNYRVFKTTDIVNPVAAVLASSANPQTLTITNVTPLESGSYFCTADDGAGGCTDATTFSSPITINVDAPSAVGTVSIDQSICTNSQPANMSIASSTGTIQWKRADDFAFTTNVTNVGTNSNTLTGAQVGNLTANRFFRATVTNGTCPLINSEVITVDINPISSVGTVSANQTICTGTQPANMTITNAIGNVQWKRADNFAFTTNVTNVGTNSLTLTGAEVGNLSATRYFRATVTNGPCSPVNSAIITVNIDAASAVGSISANQTICSGSQPANMTIASSTGTVQWKRADDLAFTSNVTNVGTNSNTLTGAQVGNLTATRYFRATVTNGSCPPINSGIITVNVDAASAVGAVSTNQTICSGTSPADMTISSSTGTVQWKRADNLAFTTNVTNVGTSSNTLTGVQVGNLTATRYFRATATNGQCSGVNSAIITVTVDAPSAVGAVSSDQTICNGSQPGDMTIASAVGIVQWKRADDLAFTTNVTNVGANSNTLTGAQVGNLSANRYFRATVTNGTCPPVNSGVITVAITATVGTPTAITISSGTEPTCQLTTGTTATTYATTASGSTSFNWSLSNSNAGVIDASTGVLTWANGFSGSVNIQVTANGCNGPSAQITRSVLVNPSPTAVFSINDTRQCLTGNSFSFNAAASAVSSGSIIQYYWSFSNPNASSDSSSLSSISKIFSSTSAAQTVTLITKTDNGCTTTSATQNVIVDPMPSAYFTISDSLTICEGEQITFTSLGNGTGGTKTFYWGTSNNDSSVTGGSSIIKTYFERSVNTYKVKLQVKTTEGCIDTQSRVITVYPLPFVNFTINDDRQCLSSNSFVFTDVSNLYIGSGSQIQTYSWNYGDNDSSSLPNGAHTYSTDGSYSVKHTIVSDKGCSHDTTLNAKVDRNPTISIVNTPNNVCSDSTITLTTSTQIGFGVPTYLWSFNSQITPNITIISSAPATATVGVNTNYTVTVTDGNQCAGTATQQITVNPNPDQPVIDYDHSASFCVGAIGRQFYVSNFQTSPHNIVYKWSVPQATRISGADKQYCNIDSPPSGIPLLNIKVTARNNFGCERTTTELVAISPGTAPQGEVMRDGSTNTLICMTNTPKSYQWGFDTITNMKETEIEGETFQDLLVGSNPDSSTSKRHYWVRITDAGGCQSKIYYQKPYRHSSLSGKETTVSVFPNPFESIINISLENFIEPSATYEVFDMQGRLLTHQSESIGSGTITINTVDWQSGLYILKLTAGSALNKTIRIVKQ